MEKQFAFRVDLIHKTLQPNISGFVCDNITLNIKVSIKNTVLNLNECNAIYKIIKPDLTEILQEATINDNLIKICLNKECDLQGSYELYFQIENEQQEQLTSDAIKFNLENNPFGVKKKKLTLFDNEGYLIKDINNFELRLRG